MSWIFLAILAYALWAITNIIDKIVVSKYVKDYFSLSLICITICSLLIFVYSVIISGLQSFGNIIISIAILAGFARAIAYYFYYKAMSYEEASRVTILTQLSPIFTLLFSVLFIRESLSFSQYFAFFLLLIAGLFASLKSDQKKIKISFVFWDMLIFAIIISASAVMMKYVFLQESFWPCMVWIALGETISAIIISILFKKHIFNVFTETSLKTKLLILTDNIFSSTALIIYSLALSLGSVSLIGVLSSLNPIFVFIFALIMGIFFPKILKEKIDQNTLLLKITSIILVIIGVYLISV